MTGINETFFRIAEWAKAHHGRPLDDIEGYWYGRAREDGADWEVYINPKAEAGTFLRDFVTYNIDAFTVDVWFNGWPAGNIGPAGGVLAAGAAANEDALLQAIAAEMERNGWPQIDVAA